MLYAGNSEYPTILVIVIICWCGQSAGNQKWDPQRLYAGVPQNKIAGQDIVRTPMRVGESDRNIQISGEKTGITKLSVSIRSQRWILEGV